jgi:hypothetical protein
MKTATMNGEILQKRFAAADGVSMARRIPELSLA